MSNEMYKILESFDSLNESNLSLTNVAQYLYDVHPELFSEYGDEYVMSVIEDFLQSGNYDSLEDIHQAIMNKLESVNETRTEISKQGNKIVVKQDGNITTFDDEETAEKFMGGNMQKESKENTESDTVAKRVKKPVKIVTDKGVKLLLGFKRGKIGTYTAFLADRGQTKKQVVSRALSGDMPVEDAIKHINDVWSDKTRQILRLDSSEKNIDESVNNEDYEVHTWFERDRAHVEVRDAKTDETILDLWDDDVQQAIDYGYLDPSDFEGSAIEYAKELGLINEDYMAEAMGGPFASKEEAINDAVSQIAGPQNPTPKEGENFVIHHKDDGWYWDERVDEIAPLLAVGARAFGASLGAATADKIFGEDEDEIELSTFDSDNPLHRKRLQRGTLVVLTPDLFKDPNCDRRGIFVKLSPSGNFGKVIRKCDGKEISVHLDDIVSADITNNSIYEEYNVNFDKLLSEGKQLNEDITVTRTTNPDNPENDTITVTGVGPEEVSEIESLLKNAGLMNDNDELSFQTAEPTVIDTGEPKALPEPSMEDILDRISTVEEDEESLEQWKDNYNKGYIPDEEDEIEGMERDIDEERDIEHANTPDEEVFDDDVMIQGLAGGLNKPKRMYKKEYPGDNPMGVLEDYGVDFNLDEEEELDEKWDKKVTVNPEERGKYSDKSVAELRKEYNRLKKSGPHPRGSKEYEKMRELAFAIRAKTGWGKVNEEELTEKSPPGMEDWIRKNKKRFIDQYGKDKGLQVLYATAWKRHNENESIEQPVNESDELSNFLNLYKEFSIRGEKKN